MPSNYISILMSIIFLYTINSPDREKIEVPLVSADTKYSYVIGNGTDRVLNFYMSTDSSKWEMQTLKNNFQARLFYEQSAMFFKVYTKQNSFISYKISGNATYKIYFNPGVKKYDLMYFTPVTISF
ncbi:MAG: hypothetical protein ABIT58_08855 [Ferruginibacter sp.]